MPVSAFLAIPILRQCDLVVLIPGWKKSTGAINEWKEALKFGIPVMEWGKQIGPKT
ncbi:MAG: DUF4406 domain-containing protein [Deltaproteobacteria bacterium]|nr:DUF4406 domain-containing protein [Deltaproteobacteria bacterium]